MPNVWSIVLAAGQGRRLASLTGGVPKQFWAPDGRRTLLEHTLDRLSPLVPPTRTVTVIDRSQRALAEARFRASSSESFGFLLDQPSDRGTAAGVALGLWAISANDPDAIIILTPSDHGVDQISEFHSGVDRAIARVQSGREEVVLFGVRPDRAIGDYGWITPGNARGSRGFRRIASFVEKPAPAEARRLFARGAVWNTMIMVGSVRAFAPLYEQHLPEIFALFQRAHEIGRADRDAFLDAAYRSMQPVDFSRDLLAPAANLTLHTWNTSIGWSDLGTPERLVAWLNRSERASRAPAAPLVETMAAVCRPRGDGRVIEAPARVTNVVV